MDIRKQSLKPHDLYRPVLQELLAERRITTASTILVVCGADVDHEALTSLNFENVTISNLDDRVTEQTENRFAPYEWSYQDAESLSYPDNSFDLVIVHSGLHHLHCPHKGITEMYRVSSSGVLGFEPNKNWFTSFGVKLGFGQDYETMAVYENDCKWGGVANSSIPNYVYRFAKDDIVRTTQAFSPIAKLHYRFWYSIRIPGRLSKLSNGLLGAVMKVFAPIIVCLGRRFPSFANNMAFYIAKPDIQRDLFPWLKVAEDGSVASDPEHFNRIYK